MSGAMKELKGKMQNSRCFLLTRFPSWKRIINKEGRIFSENIQELPQDIINILVPLKVKSVLVYPLYIENHLW